MTVQPFPFDKLKSFSKSDALLWQKALKIYELPVFKKDLMQQIAEPLSKVMKSSVQVTLETVTSLNFAAIKKTVGIGQSLGVFRVEPHGDRGLLVVENLFAKLMVERMLSERDVTEDSLIRLRTRPLTALEEGALQYAFLLIFKKMSAVLDLPQLQFKFESFERDLSRVRLSADDEQSMMHLKIRLECFGEIFHVSLYLPLIVEESLSQKDENESFKSERLRHFSEFPLTMTLLAGELEITAQEFSTLSEGDIVLFSNSTLSDFNSGQGQARLVFGDDLNDHGLSICVKQQGQQWVILSE